MADKHSQDIRVTQDEIRFLLDGCGVLKKEGKRVPEQVFEEPLKPGGKVVDEFFVQYRQVETHS